MKKSSFEQMGDTYRQIGDYLLPDLICHSKKTIPSVCRNSSTPGI